MQSTRKPAASYDKEEINRSVNMYYDSIAPEIDDNERPESNRDDKNKFQEPMNTNKKRKSRFEDSLS